MTEPIYSTIILDFAKVINTVTSTFSVGGYKTMANMLAGPLGLCCIIYICLKGFAITRGVIKTPIDEFSKMAVRMGLVYMFAMNWGLFSEYVVMLFENGTAEIGSALVNLNPLDVPIFAGSGIEGSMQSVMTEVVRVANWTWSKGSLRHPGPYLTSIMVGASGLIVVFRAAFEIFVAKLMMPILFVTAPFFIPLTLFSQTKKMFDDWLGSLVSYSLIFIFVPATTSLSMSFLHWCVEAPFKNHASEINLVSGVPIIFCGMISVGLIDQAVSLAKRIGGGCSTGHGSAIMGSMVGSAIGSSRLMKNVLGKSLNPSKKALGAALGARKNLTALGIAAGALGLKGALAAGKAGLVAGGAALSGGSAAIKSIRKRMQKGGKN